MSVDALTQTSEFGETVRTDLAAELDGRGVEVIAIREGGLVECYVPFDLIDNEEVPVKDEWAQALADQMGRIAEVEGGTGQHTPITLGLIEGEPLKIMDGFHRSSGLKRRGENRVYATVKSTDWNGLYDYRIFTAKDHVHVRFSRVVQWMREVWQYSGLVDKMTIEQAVLLYRFGTDGSKLGLEPQDVSAAKAWVERKEEAWGIAAMTIHSHLKIAESVDPKLVHATREKTSGKSLEAPTQSILKVFSEVLPNNFLLQNLVMEVAIEVSRDHNLKTPQIKALCKLIKDCDDIEAAQAVMAEVDWENLEPDYGRTVQKDLRRAYDLRLQGAAALRQATANVANVMARAQQSISRGEKVTEEMRSNLEAAQERTRGLIAELGKLGVTLSELVESGYVPSKDEEDADKDEAEPAQESRPNDAVGSDNSSDTQPTSGDNKDDDPGSRVHGTTASEASSRSKKPGIHLVKPPINPQVGRSAIEAEAARGDRFKAEIRDFLNGRAEDPPVITTRRDIARAEAVIREGLFSGDPALQDDLREEIQIARSALASRSA